MAARASVVFGIAYRGVIATETRANTFILPIFSCDAFEVFSLY